MKKMALKPSIEFIKPANARDYKVSQSVGLSSIDVGGDDTAPLQLGPDALN